MGPGLRTSACHSGRAVAAPSATGKQLILTKGDNNNVDDRTLYNPGQIWIERSDIIGRARAYGAPSATAL